MSVRQATAFAALAGSSIVSRELQLACAVVAEELGPYRPVINRAWQPFARACGVRENGTVDPAPPFFVGPDFAWVMNELAAFDRSTGDGEFGLVVPTALLGRQAKPLDPTLQLWQSNYTPVTVHRVPIDTGTGTVEVVTAIARKAQAVS